MKDQEKTNAQLLDELATTRQRVIELEAQITQSQKIKDFLEEKNEISLDLWCQMIHEFRTPITSIQAYVELIKKLEEQHESKKELKKELLQEVNKKCKQLSSLIDEGIDLQDLTSWQIDLQITDFKLAKMINNITNEYQSWKKENNNASFVYEPSTSLPYWVRGDEEKLRRVLVYLLRHAFKYTEDGVVTLKVNFHEVNTYFEINSISGKPSENFHVFVHPISQPKLSSRLKDLSISKMLIELMGGELIYENREDNLNRIDVFWFELNLPEVEPPSEEANI